ISVGSFTYTGLLPAGQTYSRSEQFQLPVNTSGLYQVVITTNATHSLYEPITNNNTTADDGTVQITIPPLPDLQVSQVQGATQVTAGHTSQIAFTVINQGTAPA